MVSAASVASAGPIDQARQLYNDGDYEAVVEKMRPVVKRSPRDGNANYFLGASLYALGQLDEAENLSKQLKVVVLPMRREFSP